MERPLIKIAKLDTPKRVIEWVNQVGNYEQWIDDLLKNYGFKIEDKTIDHFLAHSLSTNRGGFHKYHTGIYERDVSSIDGAYIPDYTDNIKQADEKLAKKINRYLEEYPNSKVYTAITHSTRVAKFTELCKQAGFQTEELKKVA